MVRTLPRTAGDPALSGACGQTPRPETRHAVQHPRDRRRSSTKPPISGPCIPTRAKRSPRAILITAVGTLSTTNMPQFKGLERFKGKWYHTSRFPHTGVDFTGKRVAVVGTGATAVQAIPEIAQQAKQLTVFQRTANYCVPARNGKVDPEVIAGAQGRLRRRGQAHPRIVLWPGALLHPEVGAGSYARGARTRIRQDVGCRRLCLLAGQLPGHVLRPAGQ